MPDIFHTPGRGCCCCPLLSLGLVSRVHCVGSVVKNDHKLNITHRNNLLCEFWRPELELPKSCIVWWLPVYLTCSCILPACVVLVTQPRPVCVTLPLPVSCENAVPQSGPICWSRVPIPTMSAEALSPGFQEPRPAIFGSHDIKEGLG